MSIHPTPPVDLATRLPNCTTIAPIGTRLSRFYNNAFCPTHFDTSTGGRWNAPSGEFGVLYAAKQREGAFAEVFLRSPGRNLIPTDILNAKGECTYQVVNDLKCVQFYGSALARLGATAEVSHRGIPYALPQAWSKAIWLADISIDGIAYQSRHDDQQVCFALFDRAVEKIEELKIVKRLDADKVGTLLETYAVGIPPN